MKTRNLTDLIHFTDDAPRTEVLVETGKLWSQVVCLQGAQGIGPMRDDDADGLVVVLAGEIAAQVGKGRARMRQWETVTVPAGEDLTMRNASADPGVVLLILSPPPAPDTAARAAPS
jgi:quercetin dioxygenase-like cupin family protein